MIAIIEKKKSLNAFQGFFFASITQKAKSPFKKTQKYYKKKIEDKEV